MANGEVVSQYGIFGAKGATLYPRYKGGEEGGLFGGGGSDLISPHEQKDAVLELILARQPIPHAFPTFVDVGFVGIRGDIGRAAPLGRHLAYAEVPPSRHVLQFEFAGKGSRLKE